MALHPPAVWAIPQEHEESGEKEQEFSFHPTVRVNVKADKWPQHSEGAEFKSTVIFRSNFGMENVFQLNELVSYILVECCSLNQLVK